MRAIWKGTLSFGLLSIPVTVHAAVGSKERVSFRLLHKKDMAPVKNQRVCSLDGEVLEWDDIVKGYEYAKGQFAPVEKEEIEAIKEQESSSEIELLEFVNRGEVDPMSFDTPYFLRPDKGAERAYTVLREALNAEKKIGIVRVAMRGVPHLAALHIEKEALAMTTLRPAEELRDVSEVDVPLRNVKPQEVEIASELIEQMTQAWKPTDYKDEYRERLRELIEKKIPARTLREMRAAKVETTAPGVDLVEALRKSLSGARKQQHGTREKARPSHPKRAAAKKSTSRRKHAA